MAISSLHRPEICRRRKSYHCCQGLAVPTLRLGVSASLKDAGIADVATAAIAVLATNALAATVLLGSDTGELAFFPSSFTVASGEKIVFINNAGFPHNVVFDEDEVPARVDAGKIWMGEEDFLNAPGEE